MFIYIYYVLSILYLLSKLLCTAILQGQDY